MTSDIPEWHSEVSKVVISDLPVSDGMSFLLSYCSKQCRWKGWNEIRELDFDSDVKHLEKWLADVLTKEPPSGAVNAFWFGILNPVYDGEASCDMYVCGANVFDPEDGSFEWACEPTYFPDDRYARSTVLHDIYRIVQSARSPACEMGEYLLCLAYAALAMRALTSNVKKQLWLGKAQQRGLAVGFDTGDGVLLDTLTW
jgi:hypothetical protein